MQELQSMILFDISEKQLSSILIQDGQFRDANSEIDEGSVHKPICSADARIAMWSNRRLIFSTAA